MQYGDEESLEKKAKLKAKRQQKSTGEAQDWEDFLETGEDGPLFKMCWYRYVLHFARTFVVPRTKLTRLCRRSVIIDEARGSCRCPQGRLMSCLTPPIARQRAFATATLRSRARSRGSTASTAGR